MLRSGGMVRGVGDPVRTLPFCIRNYRKVPPKFTFGTTLPPHASLARVFRHLHICASPTSEKSRMRGLEIKNLPITLLIGW